MKSEPITTLAQASTQATNDEISLFEVASSLGGTNPYCRGNLRSWTAECA